MNKKRKIILIANTYNFFNSFMLNNIEQLSKKNELFICCNNAIKLKKKIPKNVSLININFRRGLSIFHDLFLFLFTLFFFLKQKPNISISFTPKIGFMVALASFIARTPNRVHWFTGQIWARSKGLSRIFFKLIDKLIFFLSCCVLIDGHSQRNFLIKEKVVSKKKSFVLNKGSVGGVNILKFRHNEQKRIKLRKYHSIDKNSFIFLYLGRINKEKGIIELTKAFKEIEKNKNILLVFVGKIEDKKLKNLFKNNKKILYFEYTTKPEDWFSFSDILCLPSHREGFGTVVIEAASCGIPSLCSNIYGLKDAIVKNKTGFLHNVEIRMNIKRKMLYIINNKKLVKKYGKLAKIRVLKDFEQNLITKKLLRFINSNIFKNEN